jgi:uncharacterized protein (TIGR03790 family)
MRLPRSLILAQLFACADPGPTAKGGDSAAEQDTAADTAAPPGPPTLLLPDPGLGPEDFAVVVNTDDPNSAGAAAAWAAARGVPEIRIHALSLGTADTLGREDFESAESALNAALGDDVQALVLAFTVPYRVDCMGASAAFALGFDEDYCSTPCSTTRASGLHDTDSVAPWTDHGVRPTMMLPTSDLDATQALIDRGVAADGTNPRTTTGCCAPPTPPAACAMGTLKTRWIASMRGAWRSPMSTTRTAPVRTP